MHFPSNPLMTQRRMRWYWIDSGNMEYPHPAHRYCYWQHTAYPLPAHTLSHHTSHHCPMMWYFPYYLSFHFLSAIDTPQNRYSEHQEKGDSAHIVLHAMTAGPHHHRFHSLIGKNCYRYYFSRHYLPHHHILRNSHACHCRR